MIELLPCPFCGGEAFESIAGVSCAKCGGTMQGGVQYGGADWDKVDEAWNTREERTCEWLPEHSGNAYDKWRCSKCGYLFVENKTDGGATELDPNYCPNCGARVKEES